MRSFHSLLLIPLAMLSTFDAKAAVFIVGSAGGAGCTHNTIASALLAAEQSPGPDTVRLSRMLTYTQQQISFATGQELEIAGGFETCSSAQAGGTTTLDGAGGNTTAVMNATLGSGAILTLRDLTIRNGDADGDGGGLSIRSNGLVRILDSTIFNNSARLGGGIYFEGTGDSATLEVGDGTSILGNVARRNGGGIYADDADVRIVDPRTYVFNNVAEGGEGSEGLGGGVLLRACDRTSTVFVASPGLNGAGVISSNRATRGGGVAVAVGTGCGDNKRAIASVYRGLNGLPKFFNNTATLAGGGLYARGVECFQQTCEGLILIRGGIFEGNVAPRGSAIQVARSGENGGSELFVNQNIGPIPPDARDCPEPLLCTQFLGNVNADVNGAAQTGATIESDGAFAPIHFRNTLFAGNRGTWVIRTSHAFRLESSAVTANTVIEAPIVIPSYSDATPREALFRDVTIAGNSFIGDSTIRVDNRNTTIERSIIWQPGKFSIAQSRGGAFNVQAVIANDLTTLVGPATGRTVDEQPRFVDPANGDFHLRAASPAVDFLEALTGDDRDLEQRFRDRDLATVPDRFGPRDLGAYERQSLLPIVLNGDIATIDGTPNLWTLLVPQAKYSNDNAPGSPSGTGSIQLEGGVGPIVTVASQCIEIPGPDTYSLNGSARAVDGPSSVRDTMAIAWVLHRGANCSGAVIAQGVKPLGSTSAWSRPTTRAVITVAPVDWTRDTSLLLTLRVGETSQVAGATTNGWFDRITLDDFVTDNQLFSNGFE